MYRAYSLVICVLLTALSCGPGGAAKAIRGDAPKLGDSDGEPGACEPSARYDTLAVDWDPELRGDLEVAMKQGVAVVSYDCETIALIEDCVIEGSYGYIGMTRKEKVIKMKDGDEVKANLPVSGLKWLTDLGGELKRGKSLDVAMIMVGKQATAARGAGVTPTGECGGATHYVSAATMGAFVMASSAAAEVQAAATLFGKGASGKSSSGIEVHNKDGSLDACAKATPDDKKPPGQCGAVLRLKLKPVKVASADDAVDVVSCPPGLVHADGACVKPSDEPHQCEVGKADDCRAQCDAGDAASCYILGTMYERAIAVDTDRREAARYHRKGCEGGYLAACRAAGRAARSGKGGERDVANAEALFEQACTGGDAMGCVELGDLLVEQKRGSDALLLFRKACYGGEYEGCGRIGTLYAGGKAGLRKNFKLANKFFEKGCKEGSMQACAELAESYKSGRGVNKDKARATELLDRACNKGYEPACGK